MRTIIFLCKIQFLKIVVFTYKIYLERMAGCWTAILAEGTASLWGGGIKVALPYLLLLSLPNRTKLPFAHSSLQHTYTEYYSPYTIPHLKIIFCMSPLNTFKGGCKIIFMLILSNLYQNLKKQDQSNCFCHTVFKPYLHPHVLYNMSKSLSPQFTKPKRQNNTHYVSTCKLS